VRRQAWLAGAIAIVAVTAGCGSTGGNHGASPPDTGGSGASTSTTRAKAVKFAECMRSNGLGGFPDPHASRALTIDAVANGSSLNTSSGTFKHALSTCKHLEPAGFTGNQRSPQEQTAALAFAHCVRENGVRDFPDPSKTDPLVDTDRIPSAAKPGGLTILNAAMRKCGRYAAAAGVRGAK
jgi:hypothetical protein